MSDDGVICSRCFVRATSPVSYAPTCFQGVEHDWQLGGVPRPPEARPKPLKRYRVTAEITIRVSTVVLATSASAAVRLAGDQPMMSLCHQCADGSQENEWVTSGELDGEPQNLQAEQEDE